MKGMFSKRLRSVAIFTAASILLAGYQSVQASGLCYDYNKDGVVDKVDYEMAKSYYNKANKTYDLNKNGKVDSYDLAAISKNFDSQYKFNDNYAIGNIQGNLLNSSYVAYSGGWLYYKNTQDGGKLYKSKNDSSLRTKLCNDNVSSINIIAGTIYYSNLSDGGRLYKINTDGSGRTCVVKENVGDFVVSGAKVYYKSKSDEKLYSIDLSKLSKKVISNDKVDLFTVKGAAVYYINKSDFKLYSVTIDGQNRKAVIADKVYNFDIESSNIYYISAQDYYIYSTNLSGGQKTAVYKGQTLDINVDNGVVYFTKKQSGALYKVNCDGTKLKAIQQEVLPTAKGSSKLLVIGSWIYYTNAADGNRLYRITIYGNSKKDMDTIVKGMIVDTQYCNIRSMPKMGDQYVLGQLHTGDKVEIIGREPGENMVWYKINFTLQGKLMTGYVYFNYVVPLNNDRMDDYIGSLSAKYESAGDPGAISNTAGDEGGKSYGVWQFAENTGSLTEFVCWLKGKNINFYNSLMNAWKKDAGYGTNFDSTWKSIATNYFEEFYKLQQENVKENYYDPVVKIIKDNYNIDMDTKGLAMMNAVFSTAVQHGVNGAAGPTEGYTKDGVLTAVIKQKPASDEDFVKKIYTERAKLNIYFPSYDPNNKDDKKILDALAARFKAEGEDAVQIYENEK